MVRTRRTDTANGADDATSDRLTPAKVRAAALALVDREGLAALSMRRLGQALGVEAMSLYNHVPGKAALLDGLYEAILAEAAPPRRHDFPQGLRELSRGLRAALLAHPRALGVLAGRPLLTPAALQRLDGAIGPLRAAGLSPSECVYALHGLLTLVIGNVLGQAGPRAETGLPEAVASRLPAPELPQLSALAPQLRVLDGDGDGEFEFGLDLFVRGLVARAEARTEARTEARADRREARGSDEG